MLPNVPGIMDTYEPPKVYQKSLIELVSFVYISELIFSAPSAFMQSPAAFEPAHSVDVFAKFRSYSWN
jgi:hypothetical protein